MPLPHLSVKGTPEEKIQKLGKIVSVLMDQVERKTDVQGSAYSMFQAAILLEDKVQERTRALEAALHDLEIARREAETAQQHLREAIESISEGFALFDYNDRLVLWNARFKEFWIKAGAHLYEGVEFADLSRATVERGMIADAEDDPEEWLRQRMLHHQNPGDPFTCKLSNGRWLQINERTTADRGVVGLYTDITEVKTSEKERRERELMEKSILLQSTLDNLSQGVSVYDANLNLVAWNERFKALLDLPDWFIQAGMHYEKILTFLAERGEFQEDNREAVEKRLARALTFSRFTLEYQRPTGTILEVRRAPMPDGGFVNTYTDVTQTRQSALALQEAKVSLERRVAERTLKLTELNQQLSQEIVERTEVEKALRVAKNAAEEANVSKTKFLAAASHDLLQPINAARLFITALAERKHTSENRVLVDSIDGSMRSIEDVLNALLDISKLDAGVVPTEVTQIHLQDLLKRLVLELRPAAHHHGLKIQLVDTSLHVRSDVRLLTRVLRNFIVNATRYTEAGRILVGCRRRGDAVDIQVWDTGVGIPQDRVAEIFEEFRQLDTGIKQGEKGAGLGLAIVERIARMLQHPIGVVSKPGQGSMFFITVPLSPEVAADPVLTPVVSQRPTMENIRIAVIDNDKAILGGMESLLAGWKCHPIVAGTEKELFKKLQREALPPQVLLVDYHLDDGDDGIRLAHAVADYLGGPIPTVVITADRTDDVLQRSQEAGFHLLRKPLRPARLRSLIAHICPE
ncbi:MAG: NahK/ErcS family hybrid sensor histidine kinase/response regulator [Magnetospiraceae bacterium]